MFEVAKTDHILPLIFKFLKLYRKIKRLCTICTIILIVVSILQTYQLYHNFSSEIVLKYGSFYTGCIFISCNCIIYLREAESVNKIVSSFKPLFIVNTENILDQTTTEIKVLVAKTNALFAIWLATALFSMDILFYCWLFDKDERMLIMVFLKQYTNCNSFVIELINYVILMSIQFLCICCTVPIYFIYLIFYLKLNLIILTDQVKRFRNNLTRCGPDYLQTAIIKDVIEFISREFLRINRATLDIMAKQQVNCVLFICTGFLVGIMGCCTFFLSNSSPMEGLVIFTSYFTFGITICSYVQTYENDCVDLYYAILDLNWYEWNVKYQKMYLTVVTNTCKIIHIKLFWVVDINHDLFKKICRFTYTAFNLFYSVR